MAVAKTNHLICTRCGNRIKIGTELKWYNRPKAKSPYHAGCKPLEGSDEIEFYEETHEEAKPEEAVPVETPKATKIPSLEEIIKAIIDERLQGFKPEESITRETVEQIVRETIAPSTKVEITLPDGTESKIEGAHFLMPRLLKLVGAGLPVYLHGPAGSGKTTAAMQAAMALKRKFEIDTLDRSTPKSGIFGYRTPTGEVVETAFTRCYGKGQIYIADEADNAPAYVQTLFNSALANGFAPGAGGMISKHEAFGFIGAGNTPFRPTPAFPDRWLGSQAFIDRLYFMHWPIDPAIECRLAGLPCPRPPARKGSTCSDTEWISWVLKIRTWAEANAPTMQITPRASIQGRLAIALGETSLEAAHGMIFRGCDSTLVGKVLEACPLP